MCVFRFLAAVLVVVGVGMGSQADERSSSTGQRGSPPLYFQRYVSPIQPLFRAESSALNAAQKDQYKQEIKGWIFRVVTDAAERGTNIYNQGSNNPDAYLQSYYYFQATLLSISHYVQLVDEELAGRVGSALARANDVNAVPTDWEAAIVLRTALNDVRNRTWQTKEGKSPTLMDRLGGEDTVREIVKMAFDLASKDRDVNFDRNGEYPYTSSRPDRLVELGVDAIRALSDKTKYKGRSMKAVHQGMKITSSEFNAALKCFRTALYAYCVPDKEVEELMGLLKKEKKNIVGK